MALSSTIVWEVRSAGSDTNGGGFKTGSIGTDWSQFNSAQYALTSVTTVAANAILLTSSAAANMVGNIAHIISGTNFLPGFYEIISVSVGVSITLDATCTSAAGTTGVVNIGGALATLGKIGSATANQGMVAGNIAWVKGTFTLTATDTIATVGTATSPIKIVGYGTTRGDGYLGRTNGNGPLITTNMPALNYNSTFELSITSSFVIAECLNISASINGPTCALGAVSSVIVRSVVVNASTAVGATAITLTGGSSIVFDCDATISGVSGAVAAISIGTANAVRVVANRVKGGPAKGIQIANSVGALVAFNIVYASAGNGIVTTNTVAIPHILCNTVPGDADGINILTGTGALQFIVGNLLSDNTAFGINLVSAANAAFLAYNRTRNNNSGAINLGTGWAAATNYGPVTTDLGTDFVNAGSNDYRLIPTSPAKNAGLPASRSIGALEPPPLGASHVWAE